MFKKILVCTDGSACALDAMRMAASVARRFGSDVLALNVFQNPSSDYAYIGAWELVIEPGVLDRFAEEQKDAMKLHIGPLFERLKIPCRIIQELGHPVEGILRAAERENVDLIVVGSRGLRGVKELLLGSVSNGVLQHAKCPVLIVRGENIPCGTGDFQSILLASDGSKGAQKAACVAAEMAQKFTTSLTVLNAYVDLSTVSIPGEEDAIISESDSELYAQRMLDLVKQSVGSVIHEAGVPCSYQQEIGHPDETIIRIANQREADLIVLGCRGLGGFERMLVGSVSNHVAHYANGPVLVVR